MTARMRDTVIREVAVGATLIIGLGLTGCGGSLQAHARSPSVRASGTATPSLAPSPTAVPMTSGTNIMVTGAAALDITGFDPNPTTATCAAGTYEGLDVFSLMATVSSASAGAGDIVMVQVMQQPGDWGPVYEGPGTYTIDYTGSFGLDEDPTADGVSIYPPYGAYNPTVIAQMWQGTITVNTDQQSATFAGTYGQPTETGWSDEGSVSGSAICVPGAPA